MKPQVIITLTGHPDDVQRVASIKALRAITLWGLKESKDTMDDLTHRGETYKMVPLNVNIEKAAKHFATLNKQGFNIKRLGKPSVVEQEIAKRITGVIAFANITSHYEISRALISVLELHYPNTEELNDV